jgi:nicotinate-nucleotide adenylyltransferase
MGKICLFGGCFDPIHYGHLILAEHARQFIGLDYVIFIPVGNPPHKYKLADTVTPKKHRYNMVKLAIAGNKYFKCSSYEINKKTKSYTYQTINHYKKIYPKDELFFLGGLDILIDMKTWKLGYKLLDICKFIIGYRPGISLKKISSEIKSKIILLRTPLFSISSSEVREMVRKGLSIKYLVPESVEKYIHEKGLYRR